MAKIEVAPDIRDFSDPLYEFTGDVLDVQRKIVEGGGEITPELEAALDAAQDSFEAKAIRVAAMIENLEAEGQTYTSRAKVFDEKAKRIRAKGKARENAASGLRDYLKRQFDAVGMTAVEGPDFTVRVQKNSVASILTAPDVIPVPLQAPAVFERAKVLALWETDPGSPLLEGFVIERGTHLHIS